MIDREQLRKQLLEREAARAAGNVRFLPKDSTTRLRVLSFKDAEGNEHFARTVVQWRYRKDKKATLLDRESTFGRPCAATAYHELMGEDSPFERRQTQYYVNAFNIDDKDKKLMMWGLPSTVWEAIATMLCTDDWADVLDPKKGHAFEITRRGEGLQTEYACVPCRQPYPVGNDILKMVVDPFSKVTDPGVEGQCAALRIKVEDAFPNGLEDESLMAPVTDYMMPGQEAAASNASPKTGTPARSSPTAAAPSKGNAPAGPAKKKVAEPEPEETSSYEFAEGDRVSAAVGDDTWEGEFKGLEDAETANIEFDNDPGSLYEVKLVDLTRVEPEPDQSAEDAGPVKKKTAGASAGAKGVAGKMGGNAGKAKK